jgi:hypothetical protein
MNYPLIGIKKKPFLLKIGSDKLIKQLGQRRWRWAEQCGKGRWVEPTVLQVTCAGLAWFYSLVLISSGLEQQRGFLMISFHDSKTDSQTFPTLR